MKQKNVKENKISYKWTITIHAAAPNTPPPHCHPYVSITMLPSPKCHLNVVIPTVPFQHHHHHAAIPVLSSQHCRPNVATPAFLTHAAFATLPSQCLSPHFLPFHNAVILMWPLRHNSHQKIKPFVCTTAFHLKTEKTTKIQFWKKILKRKQCKNILPSRDSETKNVKENKISYKWTFTNHAATLTLHPHAVILLLPLKLCHPQVIIPRLPSPCCLPNIIITALPSPSCHHNIVPQCCHPNISLLTLPNVAITMLSSPHSFP